MVMDRITALLRACEGESALFPPTLLYNEGWLLRLVMDWFAGRGDSGAPASHPLVPLPGAAWFSEAWLPSAFLPRFRKDRLAESWTHADGAVGHFATGNRGTADLALLPDARQFVVVEAKMFSRLSPGTKNAPCYDQAARTVACVAEALRRADRRPEHMEKLAFLLIAPQGRIDDGVFAEEMVPSSIARRVRRRAEDYAGARDEWFENWFVPASRRIDVRCLSWEQIMETIAFHDTEAGQAIDSFYGTCLRFNRPKAVTVWLGRRAFPLPSYEGPPEAGES